MIQNCIDKEAKYVIFRACQIGNNISIINLFCAHVLVSLSVESSLTS